MEFHHHLLMSVLVGITAGIYGVTGFFFSMLAAFIGGNLIDLDHFLLKRIETGDWSHLIKAIKNPVDILTSNEELLGELWLSPKKVLLSNGILTILFSLSAIILQNNFLAIIAFSAVIHVLSDFLYDKWRGRL